MSATVTLDLARAKQQILDEEIYLDPDPCESIAVKFATASPGEQAALCQEALELAGIESTIHPNGAMLDPESEDAEVTATFDEFVARRPSEDTEPHFTCEQGAVGVAGGLTILGGKASAGKTTQQLDFMLHAAAGLDYCGLSFTRPLRILFIQNEGPREATRQKLEARLAHGPHVDEPIRIWDDPVRWGQVRVSDDERRDELRAVVIRHRIDLIVADSLTRFGMTGNGTPEETRDFMQLLSEIGLGRTVAFMLLAHTRTRTDSGEDEIEQLAGAWAPHADAILMLRKLDGNRARLSFPKTRWTHGTVPARILSFDPETEMFSVVATDDDQPEKVGPETYEQRILDWLAKHPWATTDEVDNDVEGRLGELRKARQRLKDAGRVCSTPSVQLGLPGKGQRWNLNDDAGFNPVPLPGTGTDGKGLHPAQTGNPVPGVPSLREDTQGDGVPGRVDEDELERLLADHADLATNGVGASTVDETTRSENATRASEVAL